MYMRLLAGYCARKGFDLSCYTNGITQIPHTCTCCHTGHHMSLTLCVCNLEKAPDARKQGVNGQACACASPA